MDILDRESFGDYIITYRRGSVDAGSVMKEFSNPHDTLKRGRGTIKILSTNNGLLACRKYIHGGLLRGITGDIFFNENRAANELEIMIFLETHGFPVVRPCGYITKNNFLTKDLYLLTFFEENTRDFLEFMRLSPRKERLHAVKNLALLFSEMAKLGIYHPDLHLQNVLVTQKRKLMFLDFDKAYRKKLTRNDFKKMFWRLNRFAEKKAKTGEFPAMLEEKALFIRIIEQSTGLHFIEDMQKETVGKSVPAILGGFWSRFFYKNQNSIVYTVSK
jgi:3-deoxy-D-manno-octulosonic acid kinase